MRAHFKAYKNKQIENAAKVNESSKIQDALKIAEIVALNDTLDLIVLEISVRKQVGASSDNITEKVEITNLKDYVRKNAHGLYEIQLDTSQLLTIGSNSAVKNIDNIFTSYKFTLNKYLVHKKAFDECMKTYNCYKNFGSEAAIRNAIHTNIWTNKTTS